MLWQNETIPYTASTSFRSVGGGAQSRLVAGWKFKHHCEYSERLPSNILGLAWGTQVIWIPPIGVTGASDTGNQSSAANDQEQICCNEPCIWFSTIVLGPQVISIRARSVAGRGGGCFLERETRLRPAQALSRTMRSTYTKIQNRRKGPRPVWPWSSTLVQAVFLGIMSSILARARDGKWTVLQISSKVVLHSPVSRFVVLCSPSSSFWCPDCPDLIFLRGAAAHPPLRMTLHSLGAGTPLQSSSHQHPSSPMKGGGKQNLPEQKKNHPKEEGKGTTTNQERRKKATPQQRGRRYQHVSTRELVQFLHHMVLLQQLNRDQHIEGCVPHRSHHISLAAFLDAAVDDVTENGCVLHVHQEPLRHRLSGHTHTVAYALKNPVSCDTCIVRTMFASRQSYCPPHAAHNQLQCHFLLLLFKLFIDTPSEIFHRKAAAMRSYVRHVQEASHAKETIICHRHRPSRRTRSIESCQQGGREHSCSRLESRQGWRWNGNLHIRRSYAHGGAPNKAVMRSVADLTEAEEFEGDWVRFAAARLVRQQNANFHLQSQSKTHWWCSTNASSCQGARWEVDRATSPLNPSLCRKNTRKGA